MSDESGQRRARRRRFPSVVGADLPARIRTTTFALLGLTTAAALGLVLLFAQTTPPIPSLGPLIEPAGGQAVHGGVALGSSEGSSPAAPTLVQGASTAPGSASVSASSPFAAPPPSAPTAGAGDFGAAGSPQGKFGNGPTSVEGITAPGGGQEVGAAQQPASPAPNGEQPQESAEPPSVPVSVEPPTPTSPATPTSESPPVLPEEPQPPVEEVPEGEPLPEEPPPLEEPEDPAAEDGGFLVAVGKAGDTP